MKGYTILPKKQFYNILVPLGILIFILSLEVMMRVKDLVLYEQWIETYKEVFIDSQDTGLFDVYLTTNIALYFQKIIVPIGLSIHTYFAYSKIRINKLFVFIWAVLLIGSAAYTLNGLGPLDVFFYVYILIYIFVVGKILSLLTVIDLNEKL